MHGLLSDTLLCKATLRFKNRTWYIDHKDAVEHSTVKFSTGIGTSHINRVKFRVITIKQIVDVYPMRQIRKQPLLYTSQSALLGRASSGP